MHDRRDHRRADQHPPQHPRVRHQIERDQNRDQRAAHVERDDRGPRRRVERDVHVTAEQGEHHDRKRVARMDADLAVGVGQDAHLDQEDQQPEQDQEHEDQRQAGRVGHRLEVIALSLIGRRSATSRRRHRPDTTSRTREPGRGSWPRWGRTR